MTDCKLEYKNWDSSFFGQEIYHLEVNNINKLTEDLCSQLNNALIQTKIEANDFKSMDIVQKHGFNFVESEITFEYAISTCDKKNIEVYSASSDDIDEIQKMIVSSFSYSRFRSPWYNTDDFYRFYAEWAKNAVLQQYDDFCFKITHNELNRINGIISLKYLDSDTIRIGLICVAKEYQNQNIGSELLDILHYWCFTKGIKKIYVSTQASNQKACKFYLRNGYNFNSISHWFYKRGL